MKEIIERLKAFILNIRQTRSKSRLRLYFLILNGLLLAGALVLLPWQTHRLEKEALNQRQALHMKRNTLKNLERVDTIEAACNQYRLRFMERDYLPTLLKDLAEMAAQQKVDIVGVEYKHLPELRENLQEVSMEMTVRGPYTLLRRYLHAVKGYKVPLLIKEVSISSTKREKMGDKIDLKIGMVTYFR